MDDASLLSAFEDCSYPFSEWNHRAHVRVAFLFLARHEPDEAMDRMRSGIRAYNAAHHVPEGPRSGYHETTTQAFMRLIHAAMQADSARADSEAFCAAHPELMTRQVLLQYYSRECILSIEAKSRFVEPDLAPLTRKPAAT